MLRNRILLISTLLLSFASAAFAQTQSDDDETVISSERTFLQSLSDSSDKTKGTVSLKMDSRLVGLMEQRHEISLSEGPRKTVPGYRVQVFSSNQSTAKTDADAVILQLKSKMPQLPVYISYQSPFWKVRVGNCETAADAQQLKNDIKEAFPELASEIYIVKGKISVPE